ncbi:hypothetical protein [Sphingobium sp. UBA5915]|uniref:hypothetical protein n=1 Tax=Sphingobium sp. UBA5915 TaxID=1947530 RepID=UPI0025F719D2|nr:hypothetical protein [Sphingobium sp. UBA5915]
MADIYERMRATAQRLLAPTSQGGYGQGSILLVTEIDGPPPSLPWEPPATSTRQVTVLSGAVRGVGKELIGAPVETGGQIVATDLQVIVAPWGGEYDPGQVMEIDGAPVTILKVENIPAAGTVVAIRFLVRR